MTTAKYDYDSENITEGFKKAAMSLMVKLMNPNLVTPTPSLIWGEAIC